MTADGIRRAARRIVLCACAALCILSLAGWARSRWVGEELRYTVYRDASTADRCAIAHGGGDFVLVRSMGLMINDAARPRWAYVGNTPVPARYNLPDYVAGIGGYGICRVRVPDALIVRYDAVALPYWLITVATAPPFFLGAWRHWRGRAARRMAAGLCPACGYDVRASPGRCPECGTDGSRVAA